MYWHRDHLPGASEDAISDAVEHAIELQPWLKNCPAFGQDYVLSGSFELYVKILMRSWAPVRQE